MVYYETFQIKIWIVLALSLLCSSYTLAQNRIEGRVLDAKTREPLPFAKVYLCEGQVTITNLEGEYVIMAKPTDTVTITYIGYEQVKLPAKSIPRRLYLRMATSTMEEVTVKPITATLVEIVKKLNNDYSVHRYDKGLYYYRENLTAVREDTLNVLIEAIIQANSAINLREFAMYKARMVGGEWGLSQVWPFAQTGPMTRDVSYWKGRFLTTPLYRRASRAFYRRNYHIGYKRIKDISGRSFYKIIFGKKIDKESLPYVTGTLYVDCESLYPLAFDGQIENVSLFTTNKGKLHKRICRIYLHIDYTTINGFLEVKNVTAVTDVGFGTRSTITIYRLDDNILAGNNIENIERLSVHGMDNIISDVESIEPDSLFWDDFEIVKRTNQENTIIQNANNGKNQKK